MVSRLRRVFQFVTHSWTEHLVLLWIWNIMITVHVAFGVSILAGGPSRFTPPTYGPLIEFTGGQTWIWGVWILGSGLAMTIPCRWMQVAGLWFGMVWCIIWCALFSVAMVEYPTASSTAAVAYAGFAMLDAALLTARVIERSRG